VRRWALAAVAVALSAAAALPVSGAPAGLGGAEKAEAAECLWQRHAKRVVRHVRRDGRLRRVVRKRRWWTCRPVLAPPVVVAPAPAPPTPPPPPPPVADPQPEPEANRLSVRAAEHYFVLSRPAVRSGAVTVELNNQGEDPHNLNVRAQGDDGPPLEIAETASLRRTTATFDLAAGKYRLWCSLPEHEERGMHTSLQVE
jgi:hypothetical protein